MRAFPALGGCLLAVTSCAAHTHTEQTCVAPTDAKGIPRPQPHQFETPESALQFLFGKIASRDLAGSLAAFPVVEHYERVTIKDYVAYTGMFLPGKYPLDDDWYDRLSHALSLYMSQYREVALKLLSDRSGEAIPVQPENMAAFLREFDGARLKALQVVAIKETRPGYRPPPNPIDKAIGVTEKRMYDVKTHLEKRDVTIMATVGRVADNWRVLSLVTAP
jgi:hypothetical protein